MAANELINVRLFGEDIARIGYDMDFAKSSFQYNPVFLESGKYQNAFPKTGILKRVAQVQIFNQYNNKTFKGLPPQIADSLPDMFGNLIFQTWLEANNKRDVSVLEQLAYVSNRGMGALEYFPSKEIPKNQAINLDEIIEILSAVLERKKKLKEQSFDSLALLNIFKMGTSAGGARPKLLISEHQETGTIIPGDLEYSDAYYHYLVKLAIGNEKEYPREIIEYCYYLLAVELGIEMMPSKLIDGKHFATQRFDRQNGKKIHTLSACGMTGWDYRLPDESTYENLFQLASFLKIPQVQINQLFLRMVFNVVFQNTDDHLKNHAFIYIPQEDAWQLSPAYDLTYALNPLINYKKVQRALAINGKRTAVGLDDILMLAEQFTIKNPKGIVQEVLATVELLAERMDEYGIPKRISSKILSEIQAEQSNLRSSL